MAAGISNPYGWAFVLGLLYGWSSCTLTCAPLISSYIIATDKGIRRGFYLTLIFNLGRIGVLVLMGFFAGLLGQAFLVTSEYRIYGIMVFCIGTILIGLWTLLKRPGSGRCSVEPGERKIIHRLLPKNFDLRVFLLGALITLFPCGGLVLVLTLSALSLSPLSGALAAFMFGIGSVLSPLLLIGGVAGWFAKKIDRNAPNLRIWVQRAAGILLIIIGLGILINVLTGIYPSGL